MKGKYKNGYFEWTIRPELVNAMKELNMKGRHFLQRIYDEAIEKEHWVFFDWFPSYEKSVKEYKEQAINNSWTNTVFQRLVKDTTNNGISDLQQGNFTWEEYEKIEKKWSGIQSVIKKIAERNEISKTEYMKVVTFIGKHTSGNRPAGTNRIIAAFLPNIVTTVVNYRYLKDVISRIRNKLPDYPKSQKDWLSDNIDFINYCNSNVEFINPWHSSVFAWYLKEYFEVENRLVQKEEAMMRKYIDLLVNNKNLILTGAPGTGKTYLAKEIANAMNAEIDFVQFHPSYDYTDFVEGLRPFQAEDSELGFKLKDGIFKSFCRNAINYGSKDNFDEKYTEFIDELSESPIEFETPTHKKKFKVEINSNRTCVAIPDVDSRSRI
ncbi:MAG: AAA domain-containing protein [bacterium]|nr:AAA domain-containing protein [bacterium]